MNPYLPQWFLCRREEFEPAYLKAYDKNLLEKKIEKSLKWLEKCELCTRKCGVNRIENEMGFCGIGRNAIVSSYFPHKGEEDCLRGFNGSGTIFFSGCNLKCVFCQNFEISWLKEGKEVSAKEIANMMIELQKMGCHNINLVTPSHIVPQFLESLKIAIENGLNLPIVYNTGSYDSLETIKLLDGIIDIYMPDFKFWDEELCKKFLNAPDYAENAKIVIKEMFRQVGHLKFDENGLALKGLLVRHLVMPNLLDQSKKILEWLANEIGKDCYVNVMEQYYPAGLVLAQPKKFKEIARPLRWSEYEEILNYAKKLGLRLDVRWL